MTNKDESAMPVFLQEGLSNNSHVEAGLTKREIFAMHAMQGLCANSIPGDHHSFDFLCREAVIYADTLINYLNQTT